MNFVRSAVSDPEAWPAKTCRHRAAFTLIEMLVIVAILGILLGLAGAGTHRALATAKRTRCAANLRQIALAAVSYADDHDGFFPWGSRNVEGYSSWCWDFVTPVGGEPQPSELWQGGYGLAEVLQCPSYRGGANWKGDPFTGYNYNCSYVGKVEGDPGRRTRPARTPQLECPAQIALFGDGEYSGGANKFMRAPKTDRQHDASGASLREAGTQGFRHGGKTNVAFADGHVESLPDSFRRNGEPGYVSPATRSGFISKDNRLYCLKAVTNEE